MTVDCSDLRRDYAHRGLHNDHVPENSMQAFENAVAENVGIELDVQLTKDMEVVVFHDSNVKRLCGVSANINKCDYAELSEMRLNGTDQRMPLLKDVLAMVNGRVPILIEIKNNGHKKRIDLPLLNVLSGYNGTCGILSFDNRLLRRIRKILPDIPRGLLIPYFKDAFSHATSIFITRFHSFYSSPDFFSFDVSMPMKTARTLSRGKLVLGWTVKGRENFRKLKGKFDGMIFEFLNDDKTQDEQIEE